MIETEALVSCRRFDREAPGQIGGSPLGSGEGEGVTVERGVKGIGGDRGKSGDEGSGVQDRRWFRDNSD